MVAALTKEQFIEKCINKFGNVLEFDKLEYKNCNTKVCLTCPKHGDFYVIPGDYLKRRNRVCCIKCFDQEEFIRKSKDLFGDKFNYDKVDYKGQEVDVCLICPIHGEFYQEPFKHLHKCVTGCPNCISEKMGRDPYTTEDFIKKSKEKFGDVLNYDKVEYINSDTTICLTCKEHGDFYIKPSSHFKSEFACRKCDYNFIGKAKEKYGDFIDYSKVNYIDTTTPVYLICPIHGEFYQKPIAHLNKKHPCPKCGNGVFTTEEFIKKSKEKFGDFLDYSNVVYDKYDSNVCLICPIHGDFYQTPDTHLDADSPCPKCSLKVPTNEDFIKRSREKFGDFLDYSKVEYKNSITKVCLICPIHGEFFTKPNTHFYSNFPCPKCSRGSLTKEQFIKKSKEKFGDYLDYSKVNYVDLKTEVCLVCPIHGDFYVAPDNHLNYENVCHDCASNTLTKELFIKQAIERFGDYIDYSKVNYVINSSPVCLICPVHGEYLQTPKSHLRGSGLCPKCTKNVSSGETEWLNSLGVEKRQVIINIVKRRFNVDGFNPETNTVYEYNGDFWHGNPKYYKPEDINTGNKKTFGELYEKTKNKEKTLKEAGYSVISIWESDFVKDFRP